MTLTTLTRLRNWVWFSGHPTRRNPVGRKHWSYQAENLEDRALLSAAAIAPDTVMEVAPANAKAAVQFPQVAGTWDIEVVGQGTGTAIVTQNGAQVTVTFQAPGLGNIVLNGHFTRAHSHELSGRAHLTLPEIGRVRIQSEITFPENAESPLTFTGSSEVKGKHHFEQHYEFNGTKQGVGTLAVPAAAKESITFPNVTGNWNVTLTLPTVGSGSGVLNISQSGPGGKTIHGSGTDLPAGTSVRLTGHFQTTNHNLIEGKAVVKTNGQTYRATFSVSVDQIAEGFEGQATVKKLPGDNKTVIVVGTKLLPMA